MDCSNYYMYAVALASHYRLLILLTTPPPLARSLIFLADTGKFRVSKEGRRPHAPSPRFAIHMQLIRSPLEVRIN